MAKPKSPKLATFNLYEEDRACLARLKEVTRMNASAIVREALRLYMYGVSETPKPGPRLKKPEKRKPPTATIVPYDRTESSNTLTLVRGDDFVTKVRKRLKRAGVRAAKRRPNESIQSYRARTT